MKKTLAIAVFSATAVLPNAAQSQYYSGYGYGNSYTDSTQRYLDQQQRTVDNYMQQRRQSDMQRQIDQQRYFNRLNCINSGQMVCY